MPCVVQEDMHLTALWKADDGIPYCVVHLLENAEDSAYGTNEQIAPTQHLTGVSGSLTQAAAYDLSAQGFTVQQVEQKHIAGDGSTIVSVRYTRNVYQVLFYSEKSASASVIPELTITAKHGANIEMLWPSSRFPDQYTSGWCVAPTKSTMQTCLPVMPVGGKSFWWPNQSGRYTASLNYYIESLPGESGAIDYQGRSLKLYKADKWTSSYANGYSTHEDHYDIQGFTYLDNVTYTNDRASLIRDDSTHFHIDFYYGRNIYELRFFNAVEFERTSQLYYQQSLAGMEYVPQRPDVSTIPKDAVFAGWFTTELCLPGTEADFSQTMPDHDIILYAAWRPQSYQVRVYLDREGTRPYTTVDWCVTSGRTISDEGLSLPDVSELVKPDADSGPDDFLGWEYQTENDGKKLFHPDMHITQDIVLFPRWRVEKAYQVTYRAGTWGSGNPPVDEQGYGYGAKAAVLGPSSLKGKNGALFIGWLSSVDGRVYQPRGAVTVTENMTLTAQWAMPMGPVRLTYHANNGSGLTQTQSGPNNSQVVIRANPFSWNNKIFIGWNTQPDGGGDSYIPGSRARIKLREANDLYAQWVDAYYTVTSSVEGGTIAPEGDTRVAYMETLAVRYAAKPGYELRSVVVDGVEVADSYPAAYWFGNVNANHRIHVVYRPMETGVTVNYYRDTVGPGNLLGTYRATARVDDRFVVPPGENEGCLNAKKPAEGYQDGASTPNASVVSADAQSNVISVVYARRTDLDYVIHHCEWGTGRQLAQSTARKGTFGEEILAGDWKLNIPGYVYHSCDPTSGLILGSGADTLTLYYAAEPVLKAQYKVEYFYDGNRDEAATLVCETAVGEVISAYPDKSKAGYRFVRDTGPLAVGADSEGNVIRVYYERIKEKPPEDGNDKPGSNKPGGGPSKKPAMAAVDWHATGMGDAQTLGDTIE